MNYTDLANELLEMMFLLSKSHPLKQLNEFTQGEVFTLQYIAKQQKEVVPGDISSEMGISSARVAATLNSLEKKGLIIRQIDKDDRRRILISLTEAGKELSEKQYNEIFIIAKDMLSDLGDRDAKEYVRLIDKLVKVAQNKKID